MCSKKMFSNLLGNNNNNDNNPHFTAASQFLLLDIYVNEVFLEMLPYKQELLATVSPSTPEV